MEKILFLSNKNPYGVYEGKNIRLFNFASILSRWFQVDLICQEKVSCPPELVDPFTDKFIFEKPPFMENFQALLCLLKGTSLVFRYQDSRIRRFIRSAGTKYKFLYCNYIHTGVNVFELPQKKIIDFVDSISLHYLEAKNVPFLRNLFYSREVPFVKKFEKMAIEAFDKVIITSSKEKTFLCNALKLPPQQAEKIHVVENGVATPQVSIDYLTTKNAIAFLGSMDYYPNIASAIRLVNEIYLPLKREFPFLRCIIIGGNPTKEVRDLGQIPGVQVTGFVDDLSQAICNADVIVLPMTIASGIQNKLLTALSFGMPTVASSRAIFNNDLMDEENLMIAESTEEFLEKTRKLILNPGLRKRIGERAKVFIQENQSWEKVANQMFSIVGQE